MTDPERARPGPPVAVQLAVLMIAGLLAAQLIGFGVVLIAPPSRTNVYQLAEVAVALRGGGLQTLAGRPLVRAVSPRPPRDSDTPSRSFQRRQIELASLMGVSLDEVRILRARPPMLVRLLSPQPVRPSPPMRPAVSLLYRKPGDPPLNSTALIPSLDSAALIASDDIVGSFVAALRRPDGQWTVVQPAAAPFPNTWQRQIGLWLAGCVLLVASASYLFARTITAPIDRFARAAQALGRDPNAPPMEVSGPAEISKAAAAFNDMRARIRRYVDDRTAMFGAISHDLRTPLARIRYKLEQGPEALKTSVASDINQMEGMIDHVLSFIREASEPRTRLRLDLLSVAECVVDPVALAGGQAQIVQSQPIEVEGDPLALQRLLTNLVDNAVKHAGGARVRVRSVDGEARVDIEDDGPGVPAAEMERVFEPFYRANRARTLDHGGVGLGLSVARSIARAHGGEVELVSRPRGLTARLRLPLAD